MSWLKSKVAFVIVFMTYVFLCDICYASVDISPYQRSCSSRYPLEKLHDIRGEIRSPVYRINSCRQWLINVTRGSTLTISFNDLDFPVGANSLCNDSYVELSEIDVVLANVGLKQWRYCVDIMRTLPPVFSSNNSVLVTYKTGPTGSGRGFSLNYISGKLHPDRRYLCRQDEFRCRDGYKKCIYKKWRCNGMVECADESDEEFCPNGKHKPTPMTEYCHAGQFSCISVKTRRSMCFYDVKKCDGVIDCLSEEDEISCQNFRSCGGHVVGLLGIIQTPYFPHGYRYVANRNCVWSINAPSGEQIQLRFKTFDLRMASDYLTIYDGPIYSKLIGKYNMMKHPPRFLESTSSEFVLRFYSDSPQSFDSLSNGQGFNLTYQRKGICFPDQKRCHGELNCYDTTSERCDGVWNCKTYGSDEKDCPRCKGTPNSFPCSSDSNRCYSLAERCNGLGYCLDNKDEINCSPDVCGPHNGTYLCSNKKCIFESWLCDGTNDCDDGSDEHNCAAMPSVRVILAAVVGSLICGLVLVIALGCTIKLFALRLHENGSAFDTPMSRLQAEFMRIPAPPPYHEAMRSSRPFEEVMAQLRAARRQRGSLGGASGVNPLYERFHGEGEDDETGETTADAAQIEDAIIHTQQEENRTEQQLSNSNEQQIESDSNYRARSISGDSSDSECILSDSYRSRNVSGHSVASSCVIQPPDDSTQDINNIGAISLPEDRVIKTSDSSNSVCILAVSDEVDDETVECRRDDVLADVTGSDTVMSLDNPVFSLETDDHRPIFDNVDTSEPQTDDVDFITAD